MDWKNKHFHQQRVYAVEREVVIAAAHRYLTESLGWTVRETADGLTGNGYSFSHAASANFKIESIGVGTRLTLHLTVERAGATGFMLFDVGGYYNIQIHKWLEGIQWLIHQQVSSDLAGTNPQIPIHNKTSACIFNGLLGFIAISFGLFFLAQLISAVVGEFTGTLYLYGKGGTLTLHGALARIVSTLILLFGLLIVWQMGKKKKPRSI